MQKSFFTTLVLSLVLNLVLVLSIYALWMHVADRDKKAEYAAQVNFKRFRVLEALLKPHLNPEDVKAIHNVSGVTYRAQVDGENIVLGDMSFRFDDESELLEIQWPR